MPAIQASDWSRFEVTGVPNVRARAADAVTETGWWPANGCSQPGIELTATNAEDAKTSGAISGKAAACADSGLPRKRPTAANTQESEYPKSSTSSIAATNR